MHWRLESKDVPSENCKNEIFLKDPSFLESIENNIYFYSEIERSKILQLNRRIRELNKELSLKKTQLSLKENIPIFLFVNSFGGSVFDGFSSMDCILSSELPVTTVVDGCCASAATFLTIVGKERLITKHSFMLIHQITSFCWGKFSEFKDELENLTNIMTMVKEIYKQYTKLPEEEIDKILKHDLWLNSEKCLEYGLVDRII
jgi:ATP-dependent protease ClpP protease subunit